MNTEKRKKPVQTLCIVELYRKFEQLQLPPYKEFFVELVAMNHGVTTEEARQAISDINKVNTLVFRTDIKSLRKGEGIKDEDKKSLMEARQVLKEIGYEANDFYNILFKTIETDFTRRGFVNKVCNALTRKGAEINKPVKKYSGKLVEAPLPEKKEEEETSYYTIKVAISPNMLAKKLGIPLHKVTKILKETNPQLTVGEEGVTVNATLPWNSI